MECIVDDTTNSVDSVAVVLDVFQETETLLLSSCIESNTNIEANAKNDELILSLQKEQELIQTYKDLLSEEQALHVAIQEAELQSVLTKLDNESDTVNQVKLTLLS
jgi:hypothetical protein